CCAGSVGSRPRPRANTSSKGAVTASPLTVATTGPDGAPASTGVCPAAPGAASRDPQPAIHAAITMACNTFFMFFGILLRLVRSQCPDRQGMDVGLHHVAQRVVYQPVPGQRRLAGEGRA